MAGYMIEIPRDIYDDLVYHAYDGADREICGILAGTYDEEKTIVKERYPAENVAETPQIRYLIDPEEQFQITEEIEADGHDVAGFYHSHPSGPPYPSDTDADRATWPGLSYLIVALDGYPFVGSWRWRDTEERFEPERMTITRD